jgi:hypothetical protein
MVRTIHTLHDSLSASLAHVLMICILYHSGFAHSAFTFAYESLVIKSSTAQTEIPPGALITFLQKGLEYIAIEEHINEVRISHTNIAFLVDVPGAITPGATTSSHSHRNHTHPQSHSNTQTLTHSCTRTITHSHSHNPQDGTIEDFDNNFSLLSPLICEAVAVKEDRRARRTTPAPPNKDEGKSSSGADSVPMDEEGAVEKGDGKAAAGFTPSSLKLV